MDHTSSLRQRLSSLEVSNRAEEAKRSEFRKKISELNAGYSEISAAKRPILEQVSSDSRKLSSLRESEKSDAAEVFTFSLLKIVFLISSSIHNGSTCVSPFRLKPCEKGLATCK